MQTTEHSGSNNYRLVPIEASRRLKNGPLYTYLALLFKSDFQTHRSAVDEETLAEITGFTERTVSNHIKYMEKAGLVEVTRTQYKRTVRKNYYEIVHPEKDFIICSESLLDLEIAGLPLDEQSELKGLLLMVKCLCVNNCNFTYYSYEKMAANLGIGLTTVKKLMPQLIDRALVEPLQGRTGYRITGPWFDKGNTYPFPKGTPERYRYIYTYIMLHCHKLGVECPEYSRDHIAPIATQVWYDGEQRRLHTHEPELMERYDLPTVLDDRLPSLKEPVGSLAYFTRVLVNKPVTTQKEEVRSYTL